MDVLRVLAGLAAALLCAASAAAVNGWSAVGPTGVMVNRIAFSARPNTVFAIAADGFYRSQDNGLSWQLISSGSLNEPSDLALDPSDPTRLYVTALDWPSLYVSTDGGSTLAAATNLPTAVTQASQVAVSRDGATLYLSSGARVFRSLDRGQSWQARTAVGTEPIARVIRLAVDPTDSTTVYASVITSAAGEAILATHDGGVTWSALTAGASAANVTHDLAIDESNPQQLWAARLDGVWMSADRGLTWNGVLTTPAVTIVVDPANPAVLYAGALSGQVLRTADFGAHWTDVTGTLRLGQVASIAVNPAQHSQVLVGGVAGLAASTTAAAAESLADLSVTASGPASAQVGDSIEVTFTVNNAGPDAAPTAQLSYQLAAGLTPATVTASGATCVAGTAGLISCALANVAVAEPISIRIDATAVVAGAQISKAFITTSSAEDSVTANNDASVTTTVTAAPVGPPTQPPTESGGGGGLSGRDLLALVLLALASCSWEKGRVAYARGRNSRDS
jgi:uncharacterized repeat protein (TIGR01451 family)